MGAPDYGIHLADTITEDEFPIAPLSDVVIIEQVTEDMSPGGIAIPSNADHRKFPCGKVVAVGPGRVYSAAMDISGHNALGYLVPMRVKVGDFVIFGKYQSAGEPIEIKGKKYLMCRENDLGGVSKIGDALRVRLAVDG